MCAVSVCWVKRLAGLSQPSRSCWKYMTLMENEHKCVRLTSSLGNASRHPSPRLCSAERSWIALLLHRIMVLQNWVRVLPGDTEPPSVYLSLSLSSSPLSF